MVNTLHSDRIGFQVTVFHQTGCYMEQMESWFDAGQVALFSDRFQTMSTHLRARSRQYACLLALLFSVSEKQKGTAEME